MKYRKKPVVVEAIQFTKDMFWNEKIRPPYIKMMNANYHAERKEIYSYKFIIETLEGDMEVKFGDWVITGINSEHYPCKPDIFEKTYELIKGDGK